MTTADRDFHVRHEARNVIYRIVQEAGGKMIMRSDAFGTTREPEPLAGIAAATALGHAVTRSVAGFARRAREDGKTWAEIGAALGAEADPETGTTTGAAAFLVLASDLGSGSPSFGWSCPACGRTVLDYGPEMGHPEDQEQGHGGGCTRLAETVRAWRAEWEGDDND
jgi:hypothetical protein